MGKAASRRRPERHHEPGRAGRRHDQDLLLIVNPAAAAGRLGRQWPAIKQRLAAAGLVFDEWLTTAPGQATEVARRAVKGKRPLVVAMGGDGMINEVFNGFFEAGRPIPTESSFGFLPFGTGGDTRRTFGIPPDLEGAVAVLREGRPRLIDAGRVTMKGQVRWFIGVAETGLGANVSDAVNRAPKALGGKVSFYVGTLRGLWSWKNKPMRVTVDGKQKRTVTAQAVNVANCQYYGAGMRIAPDAIPDDGLFEISIRGDFTTLEGLRGMNKLYDGSYLHDRSLMAKVERFRGTKVEVDFDQKVLTQVDGEVVGDSPVVYELEPGAVRVMVPK